MLRCHVEGDPHRGTVVHIDDVEFNMRIDAGDDGPCDEEVLVLDKPHDQLEQVGLSLAEAKELLSRVQECVVGAQATAGPCRLP